jgi:hypothetical protein
MRTRWITILGLAATGAVVFAGARLLSAPREISQRESIKIRDAFIQSAGLPADPSKLFVKPPRSHSEWEVQDPSYDLKIDASGKVVSFRNDKREGEVMRRLNRTGKKRFATKADAAAYLQQLAPKLGVPRNFKLVRLDLGNARGEIVAGFAQPLPGGHKVLEGPVAGEPVGINAAMLSLDVQDGVLKRLTMRSDFIVDRPNVRLSRQQAMAAAQKAYNAYYSGGRRSFHGGPMDSAGVKLGYTLQHDAGYHPAAHARLYWQVPFGDERVLVDAETGDAVVMALK